MKKKLKLNFEQLATELDVLNEMDCVTALSGYLGGSGGYYDCYYQCLSYITGNAASYYENQYQQFMGNSYTNQEGTVYYSPAYAQAHPELNLIPASQLGVDSGNAENFTDLFFDSSPVGLTPNMNYYQSNVTHYTNLLNSGYSMILTVLNGGVGHSVVIQGVTLNSSDNTLNFLCHDPQTNMTVYYNSAGSVSSGTPVNVMLLAPYGS